MADEAQGDAFDTEPTGDPDQVQLFDGAPRPLPAFSNAPWQVELIYRMALNTGVVVAALILRKIVGELAEWLGFEAMPAGVTVLITMFNISVIGIATTMVVFDILRFAYRRAPGSWKERIGW